MRVNVVMGGPSAEFEISILSGIEVIRHLRNRKDYLVRAVVITREKQFYYCDIATEVPDAPICSAPQDFPGVFAGPVSAYNSESVWAGCDVAFLALHGSFGEDGKIQGYLDTIGIPYTGSDVFASSVAMNKIATKQLLMHVGLPTPPFSLYGRNHPRLSIEDLIAKHGLPCFVKCPQSGSSRLMGRATSPTDLQRLLTELSAEADEILIESNIAGPEFTCPVIENSDGTIRALPPVEIRPRGSVYFDFHAKYTDNACEEIVPAPRPSPLLGKIQDYAIAVHTLLGCRGVSRTDMILSNDQLFILEINTLPGMTRNSLLPKSFCAAGGTYEGLVDTLIRSANTEKKLLPLEGQP